MPDNTTQQPQTQDPNTPKDPEQMLIEFLKELEQHVMELSQRVDVLEQKGQLGQ